ncbi:MAG: hypothetical protein HS115_11485 [Spirochaetales bacterium]|nr:hypothetical protein [Spirochaetales bacterium]
MRKRRMKRVYAAVIVTFFVIISCSCSDTKSQEARPDRGISVPAKQTLPKWPPISEFSGWMPGEWASDSNYPYIYFGSSTFTFKYWATAFLMLAVATILRILKFF